MRVLVGGGDNIRNWLCMGLGFTWPIMTPSSSLDKEVYAAVEGLNYYGRKSDFTHIHFHILVGTHIPFRQVDRALQRLRRKGAIRFDRKAGWTAIK